MFIVLVKIINRRHKRYIIEIFNVIEDLNIIIIGITVIISENLIYIKTKIIPTYV